MKTLITVLCLAGVLLLSTSSHSTPACGGVSLFAQYVYPTGGYTNYEPGIVIWASTPVPCCKTQTWSLERQNPTNHEWCIVATGTTFICGKTLLTTLDATGNWSMFRVSLAP